MNHFDEDTLLKSVLQLLDEHDEIRVHKHILECPECNTVYNDLRDQTKIIGSYKPPIDYTVYPLPLRKRVPYMAVLRVAAILIIGFLTGFFTSGYTHTSYINVGEQHLITKSPTTSIVQYIHCEQVDIKTGY